MQLFYFQVSQVFLYDIVKELRLYISYSRLDLFEDDANGHIVVF